MGTRRIALLFLLVAGGLLFGCATVGPQAPEEAAPAEEPVDELFEQPEPGDDAAGTTTPEGMAPEEGATTEDGAIALPGDVGAAGADGGQDIAIDDSYKMAITEGNWESAATQLEAIVQQTPSAAKAYHDLALVQVRLGRYEQAVESAQRAFELDVADVEAARLALRLLAQAGRSSDAQVFAEAAASKDPKNIDLQSLNLDVLIEKKEYLRAIDSARALLKQDEVNVAVMKNLARAYYFMGKEKTAKYVFARALELTKDDAEILYYLARIAHRTESNRDKVLALYARVAELRPDMPEVQNNIGLLFYETRNWELAEQKFRAAVGMAPKFKEARLNLANALRGLQRYDEADAVFDALMTEFPTYAETYYNRGLMYWENEFGTLGKEERLLKAADYLRQYKEVMGRELEGGETVDAYVKEVMEMAGQVKAAEEEEARLKVEALEKMKELSPKALAEAQKWDGERKRLAQARDAWQAAGNAENAERFESLVTEYDDLIAMTVADLRSAVENQVPDDISALMDELQMNTEDFATMVSEAFSEIPPPETAAPDAEPVPEEPAVEPTATEPVGETATDVVPGEVPMEAPVEYSSEPIDETPDVGPGQPDAETGPPVEAEPPVEPEG